METWDERMKGHKWHAVRWGKKTRMRMVMEKWRNTVDASKYNEMKKRGSDARTNI